MEIDQVMSNLSFDYIFCYLLYNNLLVTTIYKVKIVYIHPLNLT